MPQSVHEMCCSVSVEAAFMLLFRNCVRFHICAVFHLYGSLDYPALYTHDQTATVILKSFSFSHDMPFQDIVSQKRLVRIKVPPLC